MYSKFLREVIVRDIILGDVAVILTLMTGLTVLMGAPLKSAPV